MSPIRWALLTTASLICFCLHPVCAEVCLPALTAETIAGTTRKLGTLLRRNLNFESSDSGYASHGIHPFAAKFPPQIPRLFIEELTRSGDTVLDPMAGSGTTIVESLLLRREAFGFDIDPLAIRLCKVKTTWLSIDELQKSGIQIIAAAKRHGSDRETTEAKLNSRFDSETQEFLNYWFLPRTQLELMALISAIEQAVDSPVRDFFELVFSSTIIAKSGGVSLARDLAHSRPHRDDEKKPKNAISEFELRLAKVLRKFHALPLGVKRVFVLERNAKDLPIPSDSIDLVVTSPPYANAIDYMRAHKFSLVWLGHRISELSNLRGRYIGSEKTNGTAWERFPEKADAYCGALEGKDKGKGRVLRKYLMEMKQVLMEMRRVLRTGKAAVLVVGPSVMRGMEIPTHELLAEVAEDVGFDIAGIRKREIDRGRRMLPTSFGRNGNSMIEQRMHKEFVIGLVKR